jgi:hypothetical protein
MSQVKIFRGDKMSEKKFSTKEFLSQLRRCPEVAYEFSNEEVLGEVKRFLQYVGYKLAEANIPGKLDFYAKRQEGGTAYEIAGIVRHTMREIAEGGMAHLETIKKQLGENVDYVIAVPPVSERYLIDFMCEDNYKWLNKMQQEKYMVWLCNPQERSVWSAFGAPRDEMFKDYFKFKFGVGGIGMLLNAPYRREAKEIQRELLKE